MVILCDVQFDRPVSVYTPGQVISGKVLLTLEERLLLKALYFKVSGYAVTSWEKPTKKKGKSPPTTYANREDYLSTINYFIGSEEAIPKIVERAKYSYNFAVALPANCPPSFESDMGQIRYELQVLMDLPDKLHVCYSQTVTVQKAYDLRTEPHLARPFELEFLERKSFMKFWLHPLLIQINIPQAGYVCGENISVYVKVLNAQQLTVRDIIYKLNMLKTYTGLRKNKAKVELVRTTLQEKVRTLMGPNDDVVHHLEMLQVPHTTPLSTQLGECRCIRIGYEVEVLVTTMKKKRFVQAQVPITIGSISLRSNLRMMPVEVTGSAPTLSAAPVSDPYGLLPLTLESSSTNSLQQQAAYNRSMDQLNEKQKYILNDMQNGVSDSPAPSCSSAATTNTYSRNSSRTSKEAEAAASSNGLYPPVPSWSSTTPSKEEEAAAYARHNSQNGF